jgi:hypothetical protein
MFTEPPTLELMLTAWSIQRERGDSVADYAQDVAEAREIVSEKPASVSRGLRRAPAGADPGSRPSES